MCVAMVFRLSTQSTGCMRLHAPNMLESDHRLQGNLLLLDHLRHNRCPSRSYNDEFSDRRSMSLDMSECWRVPSSTGRIDGMFWVPAAAHTLRCVDIGNRWHLRAIRTLHFRRRIANHRGNDHVWRDHFRSKCNWRSSPSLWRNRSDDDDTVRLMLLEDYSHFLRSPRTERKSPTGIALNKSTTGEIKMWINNSLWGGWGRFARATIKFSLTIHFSLLVLIWLGLALFPIVYSQKNETSTVCFS